MTADKYRQVMLQIAEASLRSGREPGAVKLIAVSKTVGVEMVRRAAALGIEDFGENRAQDAAEKVAAMPGLRWHFIGHLQSNKVKEVLPAYILIHSLDRLSLAEALQVQAKKVGSPAEVLIQINVSGEQSKFGLAPGDLPAFLEKISVFDQVRVKGLMTMAPYLEDPEETRSYFRQLRLLRDANQKEGLALSELSMGMTNDFVVAVEEGATMVRIGSALFG
ncbi:MAG: YggS family pyridoxal phosphate-dependent enzyme [Dethiobacteria bacterium]|nr:YggS family pyridoxal phosphate-dependent enzyme [Dethiobacteria bacterium]